jgi:hypothetical protein
MKYPVVIHDLWRSLLSPYEYSSQTPPAELPVDHTWQLIPPHHEAFELEAHSLEC